jgi:hypothetical protein
MHRFLLSFADSRLWKSLARLNKQAEDLNFFNSIILGTENDLNLDFRIKHIEKLLQGSRGYGYWAWKPQILIQILNKIQFGDSILYIDAGCHLNKLGSWRLEEYFEILEKSPTGILAFQAKTPVADISPLHYDGRPLFDQPNYQWIKGDLFEYFGVRENPIYTHAQAIGATIILIKKNETSLKIVNEWLSIIEHDFSLLDDAVSKVENLPGFIEHRHDQSIFTLLCLKYQVPTLSAYEYWYPQVDRMEPDWNALKYFPIHAKRDKDLGGFDPTINFRKYFKQ